MQELLLARVEEAREGVREKLARLLSEVAIALLGAGLLALSARIRFTLPFTPVPFTLQTMTLMVLILTLKERAWRSVLAYIALGLLGAPYSRLAGGRSTCYHRRLATC